MKIFLKINMPMNTNSPICIYVPERPCLVWGQLTWGWLSDLLRFCNSEGSWAKFPYVATKEFHGTSLAIEKEGCHGLESGKSWEQQLNEWAQLCWHSRALDAPGRRKQAVLPSPLCSRKGVSWHYCFRWVLWETLLCWKMGERSLTGTCTECGAAVCEPEEGRRCREHV